MEFQQVLAEAIEARRQSYREYKLRIEKRAEELNKGAVISGYNRGLMISTEPTWGKDKRPHAPFDGYQWEDPRTGNIEVYAGGQYLPYTNEFDDLEKSEYTNEHGYWNILVTEEMIRCIEESDYHYAMDIILGKTWEIAGTKVVMMKINVHDSIKKVIQEYADQVIKALKEEAKKDKGEAPEGRVSVQGEVVSTKTDYNEYGVSIKCLIVLENKSTVWGTLPSKITNEKFRGTIKFTATFTRSDDKTHAFYKRPSLISFKAKE